MAWNLKAYGLRLTAGFDYAVCRDWLVLAIVALLPWQARVIGTIGEIDGAPWEQGTVSFFALEVLLLLALVSHLIARTLKPAENPTKFPPAFLRLWGFFMLLALFSMFWARDVRTAFFAWFRLFEGFGLAYLIWVGRFSLRRLSAAFLAGAIPSALLGLWQFFAQSTFASTLLGLAAHPAAEAGSSVIETAAGRFLRAYGPLPHPNVFGGFMASTLMISTAFFAEATARRSRRFLAVLVGLFFSALVVSFSRSAWLAFVVVLAAVAWSARRWYADEKGRLRAAFSLMVALGFLAVLVIGPVIAARVGASGRLEQQSLDERAVSIERGVQLFARHYAFGVGLGNMSLASFQELEPRAPGWSYQPAHLVPLLAGAELGFLGVALSLGAACFWIAEAWFVGRRARKPLVSALAALPAAILVIGLFDHYPLTLFAGLMLSGLIFGLFLKAEETVLPES